MKTKLIQDHSSCHFTRCGRTDSGVSALNQVSTRPLTNDPNNNYYYINLLGDCFKCEV